MRRGQSPNYILLPSYKIDSSSFFFFFLQLTVVDNKKKWRNAFFPSQKRKFEEGRRVVWWCKSGSGLSDETWQRDRDRGGEVCKKVSVESKRFLYYFVLFYYYVMCSPQLCETESRCIAILRAHAQRPAPSFHFFYSIPALSLILNSTPFSFYSNFKLLLIFYFNQYNFVIIR